MTVGSLGSDVPLGLSERRMSGMDQVAKKDPFPGDYRRFYIGGYSLHVQCVRVNT